MRRFMFPHDGDCHGRHGHDHGGFGRGPAFGKGGFRAGFGGFGMRGFGPDGFEVGGHRGGGRRRRLFDQAELQTLLLALIAEAPRHGYDLIREIESLSGGSYAPSPGVVYPALTYMEDQGLIALAPDDTARKSYQVTEQGREQLETQAETVAALRQRLASLAEAQGKSDPAPLRRAVAGLWMAVKDRLGQEGADRELVHRIAEIIDEAARKIERIEP
ncbi:PadR family transcriptional regulator [Novosphingobium album (ex Liu et al. 2023)]|uniref:PadR family transcriptional regulator n=1 Tax=Novosphingobium album (ex Liu et al. 2023) TaxID=3031130 RepID=A0ABT5WW49_9SPHN|nr:PadR family transcriptional regulator [Novosphingobium album (ex Liu et al. 2023)]MDE8654129.1 PadR family transcriptional regulator [Novosphingobium album (ex Liu et al. 2023)]